MKSCEISLFLLFFMKFGAKQGLNCRQKWGLKICARDPPTVLVLFWSRCRSISTFSPPKPRKTTILLKNVPNLTRSAEIMLFYKSVSQAFFEEFRGHGLSPAVLVPNPTKVRCKAHTIWGRSYISDLLCSPTERIVVDTFEPNSRSEIQPVLPTSDSENGGC